MRTAPAIFLLAATAFTSDQHVIPPRDSAAAYPVRAEPRMFSVGAELLTADQVHGSFSSELNRTYLVVEVGLFPSEEIKVALLDFALVPRGSQTVLRPVQSKTVAAVLTKPAGNARRPPAPGDVTVYPNVGIGYESGTGYDPVTGRRRGGWVTSAGVGVGVGGQGGQPNPPGSSDADHRTMETELTEKALPEGAITQPVAGYLYFPFPGKQKNVAYDLEYRYQGEKFLLPLGKYSAKR
jgi:hypothetical protein